MPLRNITDGIRNKLRKASNNSLSSSWLSSKHVSVITNNARQQQLPTNNENDIGVGDAPVSTPPQNPVHKINGIGDYQFIKELGTGKFCVVMLAEHYWTKQKYSIKIIDKRIHDIRVLYRLAREIDLLQVLHGHENVVQLHETYETVDTIYLVLEYLQGSTDLYDYLVQIEEEEGRSFLSEEKARDIFVIAAVSHCHNRHVVHRDIKEGNVLINPENGRIKLIDFGLGNKYRRVKRLRTICGSMLCYSPEIIRQSRYVGPEIDCWCLGIFLYRITQGFHPFGHAKTVKELRKDIVSTHYPMPFRGSDDLTNTIRKCLVEDWRQRDNIQKMLLDDPWITDHGRLDNPFPVDETTQSTLQTPRDDIFTHQHQFLCDTSSVDEEQLFGRHACKIKILHIIELSVFWTDMQRIWSNVDTQLQEVDKFTKISQSKAFSKVQVILKEAQIESVDRKVNVINDFKSTVLSIRKTWKRFPMQKVEKEAAAKLNQSSSAVTKGMRRGGFKFLNRKNDFVRYYKFMYNPNNADASSFPISIVKDLTPQQQQEHQIIQFVKYTCSILGIVFKHESPTKLLCFLKLQSFIRPDDTHPSLGRSNSRQQRRYYQRARRDSSDGNSISSNDEARLFDINQNHRRPRSQVSSMGDGNASSSSVHEINLSIQNSSEPNLGSSLFKKKSTQHSKKKLSKIWSLKGAKTSDSTTSIYHNTKQNKRQIPATTDNGVEVEEAEANETVFTTFTLEAFIVQQKDGDILGLCGTRVEGPKKAFSLGCSWIDVVLTRSGKFQNEDDETSE